MLMTTNSFPLCQYVYFCIFCTFICDKYFNNGIALFLSICVCIIIMCIKIELGDTVIYKYKIHKIVSVAIELGIVFKSTR